MAPTATLAAPAEEEASQQRQWARSAAHRERRRAEDRLRCQRMTQAILAEFTDEEELPQTPEEKLGESGEPSVIRGSTGHREVATQVGDAQEAKPSPPQVPWRRPPFGGVLAEPRILSESHPQPRRQEIPLHTIFVIDISGSMREEDVRTGEASVTLRRSDAVLLALAEFVRRRHDLSDQRLLGHASEHRIGSGANETGANCCSSAFRNETRGGGGGGGGATNFCRTGASASGATLPDKGSLPDPAKAACFQKRSGPGPRDAGQIRVEESEGNADVPFFQSIPAGKHQEDAAEDAAEDAICVPGNNNNSNSSNNNNNNSNNNNGARADAEEGDVSVYSAILFSRHAETSFAALPASQAALRLQQMRGEVHPQGVTNYLSALRELTRLLQDGDEPEEQKNQEDLQSPSTGPLSSETATREAPSSSSSSGANTTSLHRVEQIQQATTTTTTNNKKKNNNNGFNSSLSSNKYHNIRVLFLSDGRPGDGAPMLRFFQQSFCGSSTSSNISNNKNNNNNDSNNNNNHNNSNNNNDNNNSNNNNTSTSRDQSVLQHVRSFEFHTVGFGLLVPPADVCAEQRLLPACRTQHYGAAHCPEHVFHKYVLFHDEK
ncbi:unnamed protein product [Polarella glacialis]|uniref:Uncharacterized protein n=1 Tax=Polarella glacialis TaxID=89957 RepID=A0A813FI64_POLGL|nr:unnamed protein product [Polarella glacialis]